MILSEIQTFYAALCEIAEKRWYELGIRVSFYG